MRLITGKEIVMAKVFAFLAEGLEEVECLAVVDVLRRAWVETRLVSITGNCMVTGSHNHHSGGCSV